MNLNTPFTLSFGGGSKSKTMTSRIRQWEQRQKFWDAVKECHNREELKAILQQQERFEGLDEK